MFDYHTVEDLHGMSAADILAEPESRTDSKMRHFTGELNYQVVRGKGLTNTGLRSVNFGSVFFTNRPMLAQRRTQSSTPCGPRCPSYDFGTEW